MRFGVSLPTVSPAPDGGFIVEVARAAEHLGFDSVWIADHVVLPTSRTSEYPYARSTTDLAFTPGVMWLDPIATIGYVAAATERVRVGTSVLVVPYRHPVVLANELASLDRLSGGRVVVGIGVGWMDEEFDALGVPRRERGARTDEYLRAMRALWTSNGASSFEGRWVSFRDVVLATTPVTSGGPPVWVGGNEEPALRRTVEAADGWIGFDVYPEEMTDLRRAFERIAAGSGRDLAEITLSVRRGLVPPFEVTNFLPGRRSIAGSATEAADELARYEDSGVELVVFDLAMTEPETIRTLEWFAADVMPRLG